MNIKTIFSFVVFATVAMPSIGFCDESEEPAVELSVTDEEAAAQEERPIDESR